MSSSADTLDVVRRTAGALPTHDALMRTVIEQQRQLDEQRHVAARHDEIVAERDEIVAKKSELIASQQATIAVLHEQLRLARSKRFGPSSEQHIGQQDWLADETETLADGAPDPDDGERDADAAGADTGADGDGDSATPTPRDRPAGRKGLNPALPRVRREILLDDAQRRGALDTFFVKVKEELDIEPARARVIEYWQEKAVRLDAGGERTLVAAPRPAHPLGKAVVSVNLLAWLIVSKYADGLPLYRLEKVLARYGGDITRTTMANWLIRLHPVLAPLMARLEAVQLTADYLQGDETRMQVLKEPGMAATGSKWIWVMRGGPPGKPVVLFNYDRSRGGAVAERLLRDFTGRYFQSDGYSGYDAPCAAKRLVHLGCWDHARRKVVDAIRAQPKSGTAGSKGTGAKGQPSVAMVMLSHIDVLYRLERQWKDIDDDERLERRRAEALPKLAKLHAWLGTKQPKVAPDTLTRKAINYALNQWDHLVRYCEHGQLRISNACAENAIRPFAVGRRAWLFADTPAGAKASAAYFSLVETAKANGLEPYAYLQRVIGGVAAADTDAALDALLPWNVS